MYYNKLLFLICAITLSSCAHVANKDKICNEGETTIIRPIFRYAVTNKPVVNKKIIVKRSTGKVETYITDKEGYIPPICSNNKDETVEIIKP